MTDEKNKVEKTFSKKIGKTNYKVTVHFSETSDETITDKINRLIQKECEESADPFYSDANMSRLRESIRQVRDGEKKLTEHEIENK